MPRAKRKKSKINIYHVMGRALNKQVLFEDEKDCLVFLSYLKEAKEEYKFNIYAYCLMNNHFHLVIKDKFNNLSKTMNNICQRYSKYYNKKIIELDMFLMIDFIVNLLKIMNIC